MNLITDLSPDDARITNVICAAYSARAKFPISLEYLAERWTRFVAEVEQGYRATIYDYTNDLSVRDLWEDLLLRVPQPLRAKLLVMLTPWDDRFYEATRPVVKPLHTGAEAGRHWWFRVPKNLSGDLEGDLQSEGLLEY